jgi:ERCC4-type nuclease
MAAQLPGIDRKALDVSKKFKTVRGMVHASERDWMDVKGVGKVLAKRMVEIFQ